MRSPEERITEVKWRIAKKERQKRLWRYRVAAVCCGGMSCGDCECFSFHARYSQPN